MVSKDFARPFKRAADKFAEVMEGGIRHDGARLQPGHVKQIGDEPIEPLGLVDDRGDELLLRRSIQCA